LSYKFQISDKIVYFRENKVIQGKYTFTLSNPDMFKSVYVGVKNDDQFEKIPEPIINFLSFSKTLHFYRNYDDVTNRKVELLFEDSDNKYEISLCGNDLLLIEILDIEVKDFYNNDLRVYKES